MRILILSCVTMVCLSCIGSAQPSTLRDVDTNVKVVNIPEVQIKAYKNKAYSNQVKPHRIHLVFNSALGSEHRGWDSTYLLTQFSKLEDYPVQLRKIECRLQPVDTGLFTLQMVFFQVHSGDTQLRVFDIPSSVNIHNKNLVLDVSEKNLKIAPNDFYLGYGFITKKRDKQFRYSLYSSDKGKGITLKIAKGEMLIDANPVVPSALPFKIVYNPL